MILKNRLVVIVLICNLVQYIKNEFGEHEKVCIGTNHGLSGSHNDYKMLQAIYSGCVYVDGNLEIKNFKPESEDVSVYDFSFLDSIREITGYLIIFNNNLKSLSLKSLQIIRGKTLFSSNYSIFIASNENLERLDLKNLTEVQRGSSLIADNPKLCNMDEVLWNDIINDHENNYIKNNANPSLCSKCSSSCCQSGTSKSQACGCWFPNGCQKLSLLKCSSSCQGRCFGTGKYDCCFKECLGGCTGPTSKDCIACKKFRILETGECVDSCPRIKMVDTLTGELVYNQNGMYQYGISCVRSCPKNLFIYQELCVSKCPDDTNEEEEIINNPVTGEKGLRRICKPCEAPKSCAVTSASIPGEILNHENIHLLKDCEILNGNLMIIDSNIEITKLTEKDLEILSSIRVINGFVRIQSDLIYSINFLRNLEIIRAPTLEHSKYSLIIAGKSLRFLNLKKLRSIENGEIYLSAENLCLHNTINWQAITKKKNSVIDKLKMKPSCGDLKCHIACEGCWSPDQSYCQFCKNYKLEDLCIENCEGSLINN
ncbi:Epidermal growth factor receptor, partial [Brachionus plicatilis]